MQKFTKPLLSKVLNAFFYNNKPAVNVDILKLKSSQVKSLELLQSHVGKRNLVLNNNHHHFSRYYVENIYKNILYITFGGENAVASPQSIRFLEEKQGKSKISPQSNAIVGKFFSKRNEIQKPLLLKSRLPSTFLPQVIHQQL